ncbi:MAG TPA: glycosyltransferase [Candidatus Udaeobacter sp.]|jgi:glycosyltransferase involved in cell wall biosynthesis
MRPLVSILIPAYNAEPWIADTIQSALAQTWPRKEIIVVDDGSDDRTLSIANEFLSRGVFVTFQKNLGAAAARNKALSFCSGDYIQWLDADDILAPDKISRQMEFAESCTNKRILLSSEWGHFLFRTSRAKFTQTALWGDLPPVEWLRLKMEKNTWMQPGSWLVSRELTEAAGPWNERLPWDEEGEYFARVVIKSNGVKFIRGAKTFYRVTGPQSYGHVDTSNDKLESSWRSTRLHVQYLRSLEDSARTRRACVTFMQARVHHFYPHRPDLINATQRLAKTLCGEVTLGKRVESLGWKFAWIKKIFGPQFAYLAQDKLPQFKNWALRLWDRAMFQIDKTARS